MASESSSLYNVIINVLKDRDVKTTNPVFMALIVVGLFIKVAMSNIFSVEDGTIGPANAVLWGYSIVAFSILGIILINTDSTANDWNSIMKLPWTLVATIVIIIWIISMNIKYFKEINKKQAPDQYYTWSGYTSILMIFLIGISVVQYILASAGGKYSEARIFSSQLAIYGYILAIMNLISVTIMQVILDYFMVDG